MYALTSLRTRALPAMMGSGVRKIMNVVLESVEALPGIVLPQEMRVMMGCVMIMQISALPSPKPMVPCVMTDCGVQKMMLVSVECVEGQRETVRRWEMSVTMGCAMMVSISVLPNPKPMALPVMMDSIAHRLMNVKLASA